MTDRSDETFNLDELLHPVSAFGHPTEVVDDPDLTLNEKRAILASWASDACAIEPASDLSAVPNGPTVRFDDIMDALRTLDKQVGDKYRRVHRRKRILRKKGSPAHAGSGTTIQ